MMTLVILNNLFGYRVGFWCSTFFFRTATWITDEQHIHEPFDMVTKKKINVASQINYFILHLLGIRYQSSPINSRYLIPALPFHSRIRTPSSVYNKQQQQQQQITIFYFSDSIIIK